MAHKCAYCGKKNKLTKEHIWPRCIIKRVSNYNARFSERAGKFFEAELTISDVCEECNNGVLSKLDDYICEMYDKYFQHFHQKGDSVSFNYDFDKLARWLLKISYNTARTTGIDSKLLETYVPYILGIGQCPEDTFSVRVELIVPFQVADIQNNLVTVKELLPTSVRSCRAQFEGIDISWCAIRLVAINSFYFWLIFIPRNVVVDQREINSVVNLLPNNILYPECSNIVINAGTKNAVEMHRDWFERKIKEVKEFSRKTRK
ncbi:MAG: hypothetical protein CVU89_17435 [Firmicutes bacterium HGW-Firmicutes-14]|nr:MAG: hypothetical protein CVU89_17435 [Firmicutes bacterium HGW-Firmicutes-14]